jgi:hypothetical protein
LRRAGLLALVFYAAHAIALGFRMPLANQLWSCNVASLLVALGLLGGSAVVNAAGGLLLLVGEPVWIYDLVQGGAFFPTTLLTHVGVAALTLFGMRRLGVPRRAWPLAVTALAAATVAAAFTSSAADNVNVAVVTPPGFERFPSHGWYMAWLGTTLCLAMLGLMFALRRVLRATEARRLA